MSKDRDKIIAVGNATAFVVLHIQCGVHSVCKVYRPGDYEGLWSPMDGYDPQARSAWLFQDEAETNAFAKRLSGPDCVQIWGGCCEGLLAGERAFLAELEESESYAKRGRR